MSAPWNWIRLPAFVKELKKLTSHNSADVAKIVVTMKTFSEGRAMPKDHKKLDGGLEELRVSVSRGTVRLYFGRIRKEHVLVALHVHTKKRSKDRAAEATARARLKAYRQS